MKLSEQHALISMQLADNLATWGFGAGGVHEGPMTQGGVGQHRLDGKIGRTLAKGVDQRKGKGRLVRIVRVGRGRFRPVGWLDAGLDQARLLFLPRLLLGVRPVETHARRQGDQLGHQQEEHHALAVEIAPRLLIKYFMGAVDPEGLLGPAMVAVIDHHQAALDF